MTILKRDTLAEQLAQLLLQQIADDHLEPGAPLPSAAALVERYKVSRPVVREALKILEGRGIISITNGRNPTLRGLSDATLDSFFHWAILSGGSNTVELLEVRRGIEVQSALMAATRATDEELAALRETIADMGGHIFDAEAYAELDLRLHLQIASAARNAILFTLIKSIRTSLRQSILDGLRSRATREELLAVQAIHEQLYAALARRDAPESARLMGVHFDDAIAALFRGEPRHSNGAR